MMKHSCKPIPSPSARDPTLCSIPNTHKHHSLPFQSPVFPSPPTPIMASSSSPESLLKLLILLFLTYIAVLAPKIEAQVEDSSLTLMADALDWQIPMSLYGDFNVGEDGDNDVGSYGEDEFGRRSLFWKRMHYYISYGALAANRIPCRPRSGRSYYTPNCFRAHGPVNPYTRGCSQITRCRR